MKIVKLTAENIKRLVAVEITPDGNTVVIAGKNGQGKTSVLDSIWYALGGGPAARGTTKPIRDGQDHAQVTLDLGELVVTRTWQDGGKSTLKVESVDGAAYRSPQTMLDALVGRLSFDPLAFAQQDERTQLASLLELVELPFDPDELAARRQGVYDRRTEVGRVGKHLEGQLAGLPKAPAGLPAEEINVGQLVEKHRHARDQIAARDMAMRDVERMSALVERDNSRLGELLEQVEQARQTLAGHEADLEQLRSAVPAEEDLPDIAAVEKQLAEAEDVNAGVRSARQRAQVAADLEEAREAYRALTQQIGELDEQKSSAIAAAKMPIDGLAFDDSGVTYRGVPFKQCSAAEQLRVSVAMAIAMNPNIRVIRITDGSLLDSENLRLIEEMAEANDFQIWLEKVDESGGVGVLIEDGAVAAVNGKRVAAALS